MDMGTSSNMADWEIKSYTLHQLGLEFFLPNIHHARNINYGNNNQIIDSLLVAYLNPNGNFFGPESVYNSTDC